MIETEIRNLVIPTSSYITAIGSRLYIGSFPDQVTYPAAVMYSISHEEMHDANIYSDRIQFSCYADYLSSAEEVALGIRDRVKRFYGLPSAASTVTIINSAYDNMAYLYDSGVLKHVKILDMMIRYRR